MAKYNISQLKYGGELNKYFWDKSINTLGDITNGLADCTCLTLGLCLKDGLNPCSVYRSASVWHKYLINGWKAIPYQRDKVKVGDIIEWSTNCHVARVADIKDGEIYLHCSWYTGEHGVSVWNGKYDTRHFNSQKEMSDFFTINYPTRFYHYWTIEDESRGVGGQPDYILVQPNRILSDLRNETIDQIKVSTNEQNVRNKALKIIGVASEGYYDVFNSFTENNYKWWQIKNDLYIAEVKGRVEFIEGTSEVEELKKTIKDLQSRLKKIGVLADYD